MGANIILDDRERTILALECFKRLHVMALSAPYFVSFGKDGKILKGVVAVYGLDRTVLMMKQFFVNIKKDEFLRNAGASVGVFRSQIPKLIVNTPKEQGKDDRGILHTHSLGDTAT